MKVVLSILKCLSICSYTVMAVFQFIGDFLDEIVEGLE